MGTAWMTNYNAVWVWSHTIALTSLFAEVGMNEHEADINKWMDILLMGTLCFVTIINAYLKMKNIHL